MIDYDVDDDVKTKANGVILTTCSDEISEFVKRDRFIIICTYQSSDKLIEVSGDIKYDIAFFDGTHKTVCQDGKKFSLALSDENISILRRVFMTATPKVYVGGSGQQKISMNNKDIYGECVYTYNTRNAIINGYLTDYQVMTIHAENSDIEKMIVEKSLVKYQDKFCDESANYLAIILVLLDRINRGEITHLVTYHNRVASASRFAKFLKRINSELYDTDIYIDDLSGNDSMNTRNNTIREFTNSDFAIMCTARVLNEGVNIPIIDAICFVDNRYSTIDIIQCIGRSLRLYPGKEKSEIIIPVISDDIENGDYSTIIRVLKSLKMTDYRIVEFFDLQTKVNSCGGILRNEIFCTEKFSQEIDLGIWNNNITCHLWYNFDTFSKRYNELKKWVEEHDRLPSQASKNMKEKKLSNWCQTRRYDYKIGRLSNIYIKKMESLPKWFWRQEDIFDKNFRELKNFIQINNRYPLEKSDSRKETYLNHWYMSYKLKYKNDKLSENIIDKFQTLPNWYWTKDDLKYIKLQNFLDWINKHNRLPTMKGDIEERKLCKWADRQRYKKRKNKLDKYIYDELQKNSLWWWEREPNFNNMYNRLLKYVKQYNEIPKQHSKNNEDLANWCSRQRGLHRNGELDKDREKMLSKVDKWFWEKDNRFDKNYKKLKKFIKINGELPSRNIKNSKYEQSLANWCNGIRIKYRNGKLDVDTIKLFELFPQWYWCKPDYFMIKYNRYINFINTNKRFPTRRNTFEKSLYNWAYDVKKKIL